MTRQEKQKINICILAIDTTLEKRRLWFENKKYLKYQEICPCESNNLIFIKKLKEELKKLVN